jgi:RNA polymerase sporulation-specific sigma factor
LNYKDINDYEVLYMISEDKDGSYDILYRKYLPIIKSIANKYIDLVCQVGGDYQDLIQEGFLGLNNAIVSYKDDMDTLFYTYATICIQRQICSYCRNLSSKRNQVLNFSFPDDAYSCNLIEDTSYYSTSVQSLDYELIHLLFKKTYLLDLDTRCVFELRFNGFSYKEISKLLDMSLSSVDKRMVRARKLLKSFAESYELN